MAKIINVQDASKIVQINLSPKPEVKLEMSRSVIASSGGNAENANHANIADVANVAYSVSGSNVTGYVANATHANIADIVTNEEQPNIKTLRNLTDLYVSNVAMADRFMAIPGAGEMKPLSASDLAYQYGGFTFDPIAGTMTFGGWNDFRIKTNEAIVTMAYGNVVSNTLVFPDGVTDVFWYGEPYGGGIKVKNIHPDQIGSQIPLGVYHGLDLVDQPPYAPSAGGYVVSKGIFDIKTVGNPPESMTTLWSDGIIVAPLSDLPDSSSMKYFIGVFLGTYQQKTGFVNGPEFITRSLYWYDVKKVETVDDISDVTITNPLNGQVLTYSNGSWVNSAVTTVNHANIADVANVAYSVSGSNVTGYVANATHANIADVANVAYSVSGSNVTGYVANATHANIADVAKSVSGSNVVGQVANALVAGTVYTNAQPNITSVGTLTSLSVAGNINTVNGIQMNTTAALTAAVGQIVWNDADGTLDVGMKGGNVTLQVGQEQLIHVTNNSGVDLVDGDVVYVTGASGNRLAVAKASAASEPLSSATIGVVTEFIRNNTTGYITTSGLVRGLNTSAYTEGSALWLSTTPGKFTTTKPDAPNHLVLVGYVVRQHATQGSIFVKVVNGFELDEIHDVSITSPANGQVLTYDSGVWKNLAITNAAHANIADAANSVAGANVTGTVANATYATTAGTAYSVSGANVTGAVLNAINADVAYSVDGANVVGYVSNATHANIADTATLVSGSNIAGPVANATYATTAGTAYSVDGANVVGPVAGATFAATAGYANGVDGANVVGDVSGANHANIADIANVAYSVNGSNVLGYVGSAAWANTAGEAYSVSGSNVSGQVANATYATTAGTAYSVSGANVSGTVANATYATTAGTAYSVSGANVSGTVANAAYSTLAGNINLAAVTDDVLQFNGTAWVASGIVGNISTALTAILGV